METSRFHPVAKTSKRAMTWTSWSPAREGPPEITQPMDSLPTSHLLSDKLTAVDSRPRVSFFVATSFITYHSELIYKYSPLIKVASAFIQKITDGPET